MAVLKSISDSRRPRVILLTGGRRVHGDSFCPDETNRENRNVTSRLGGLV